MTDWQHYTGPLLIALGLCLGTGLATLTENEYTYASTIAVNSTYEVEMENMTSGEFVSFMDPESKATIKQTKY